jgi:hypothetical protein
MSRFTIQDAKGNERLCGVMEEVWIKLEATIRSYHGGNVPTALLDRAAEGMRGAIDQLAALGSVALQDHTRQTMFELGLINAGISPIDVPSPYGTGD